jgi:hypothetical protein
LVVYLAAAPELSWTNLPTQPLMVPLFHELIRQGLSVIRAAHELTVGEQPNLALGAAARDLVGPQDERMAIEPSGRPQQAFQRGGIYGVLDQSGQQLGRLGVNIDADAGLSDVQSVAAIESWLRSSGPWMTFEPGTIAASLGGGVSGSPMAGLLLLIVLALVVLETVLARWFSHADRKVGAWNVGIEHGFRAGSSAFSPQTSSLMPRATS